MYSVFERKRSKQLEEILTALEFDENKIAVHDQTEIVFQSTNLDAAMKHYESIKPFETKNWCIIYKTLIKTPLDEVSEDGFINGDDIKCKWFK